MEMTTNCEYSLQFELTGSVNRNVANKWNTLKEMCEKHSSDLPELASQIEEVSSFVKDNYMKADLMNLVFDKFA